MFRVVPRGLVLIGMAFVGFNVADGSRHCSASATISSPLVQASFLAFDKFIMIRARFGDEAYLAEGLQCLEGSPRGKVPAGINWHVIDPANVTVPGESNCLSGNVFNPQSGSGLNNPVDPRMRSVQSEKCNPEAYDKYPWVCEVGDWSGKFGPLDLGMKAILKELKAARFLVAAESWTDLVAELPATPLEAAPVRSTERSLVDLYPLRPREEVRVHQDDLAIPPCQLEGKLLGLFCADGRLAGCAAFRPVKPTSAGRPGAMEAAIQYIVAHPRPPPCPMLLGADRSRSAPSTTPSNEQPSNPNPQSNPSGSTPPGWTDRVSKEIGKVPDYVSSWWDDVKKKSKEAWSQMA